MLQHAVQAFLIAAILAPFSYYAGQGTRKLGLPQITGYLVSGIICGPYCLSILSATSVADLNIIEGACLGIIGLAAGAELHLPELAKHKKQVGADGGSLCQCCMLHAGCSAAGQVCKDLMLLANQGSAAPDTTSSSKQCLQQL
jgi:Kef-type K+ transport system membrane component KefB